MITRAIQRRKVARQATRTKNQGILPNKKKTSAAGVKQTQCFRNTALESKIVGNNPKLHETNWFYTNAAPSKKHGGEKSTGNMKYYLLPPLTDEAITKLAGNRRNNRAMEQVMTELTNLSKNIAKWQQLEGVENLSLNPQIKINAISKYYAKLKELMKTANTEK